jgi:ATP-dependent exoDNAse (exonuclease V) beta subunit
VDQILVVTYTVAATGEHRLLDRQMLLKAATALRAATGLNLLRTVGRLSAVTPRGGRVAL